MGKSIVKIFTIGAACISSALLVNSIYKGYKNATTPSKFENTATLLKFNGNKKVAAKIQQESLLKTFYYAGYFNPENLWQDINHLGFDNPKDVFLSIMEAVVRSGANQKDPLKFNPTILRKHLFNTDKISESDALDLIMYIGQHAFNRKTNQERNELTEQSWMKQYENEYVSDATYLGLVERKSPSYNSYDEALVLGASRHTVTGRILDHIYNKNHGTVIEGLTTALAGTRPLWVEIDGMALNTYNQLVQGTKKGKKIEDIKLYNASQEEIFSDGQEYLISLAQKNGIKIDNNKPTIVYKSGDTTIPPGFVPGRTYLNYLDPNKFLTETIMVYDILDTLSDGTIKVTDTKQSQGGRRPDTSSTAEDYANALIKRIKDGYYGDQTKFVIYVQSNQPYVERQTLSVQKQINKAVSESGIHDLEIVTDGVGYGLVEISIKRIHSELAALISEKYSYALTENEITTQRKLKDLQFSTRDNSEITLPMPDFPEVISSENQLPVIGFVENWSFQFFDE